MRRTVDLLLRSRLAQVRSSNVINSIRLYDLPQSFAVTETAPQNTDFLNRSGETTIYYITPPNPLKLNRKLRISLNQRYNLFLQNFSTPYVYFCMILPPFDKGDFTMNDRPIESRKTLKIMSIGFLIGILIEIPMIIIAFVSAGYGHGDYIAIRILFPIPMLISKLEGQIGPISLAATLLQFPTYGALINWGMQNDFTTKLKYIFFLHVVGAIACFSGIFSDWL